MIELAKEICYAHRMNTETINNRPTLKTLANEISLLRSLVIGMVGTDSEGLYRPEFVEEMLCASVSDTPRREFANGREFLRRIQRPA